MLDKLQSGRVNLLLLLAIFFGIGTLLFGTLAVVAYGQRTEAEETLNSQVNQAVVRAKALQKKASDEENAKANQLPYRVYTADKTDGGFELQIPKNWSIYAERSTTGQTQLTLLAGLDAVTVNKTGTNLQPFKMQLVRQSAVEVVKKYSDDIKKNKLKHKTIKVSGIDSTYLEGTLDAERHDGVMVIVPVRDKAMVFSTESRAFIPEFSEILAKAKINP